MAVAFNPTEFVPVSRARKTMFPRGTSGKPISPSTAWRWINRGVLTRSGKRVRLQVSYLGRSPTVSLQMVQDFLDGVAEANRVIDPDESTELSESTKRRLQAAGL